MSSNSSDSPVKSGAGKPAPWLAVWSRFNSRVVRLCDFLVYVAAFALFVLMAIMTAYVISRKLGAPIPGAYYISLELMVVVFCLPLGAVTLRNGHIIFELVDKVLPAALRSHLTVVGNLIGLAFFFVLSVYATIAGIGSFNDGEFHQGILNVSIWPFRLALAASMFVFSLTLLVVAVRGIVQHLERPSHNAGTGACT